MKEVRNGKKCYRMLPLVPAVQDGVDDHAISILFGIW